MQAASLKLVEKYVCNFVKNSRSRIDPGDEGSWKVELLNELHQLCLGLEGRVSPDLVDHNHPKKPLKKGKVVRKAF